MIYTNVLRSLIQKTFTADISRPLRNNFIFKMLIAKLFIANTSPITSVEEASVFIHLVFFNSSFVFSFLLTFTLYIKNKHSKFFKSQHKPTLHIRFSFFPPLILIYRCMQKKSMLKKAGPKFRKKWINYIVSLILYTVISYLSSLLRIQPYIDICLPVCRGFSRIKASPLPAKGCKYWLIFGTYGH